MFHKMKCLRQLWLFILGLIMSVILKLLADVDYVLWGTVAMKRGH